jgi:rhodanese-related sulfurtransferase
MVLRPPGTAWEQRFGSPAPGARQTLVFLSSDGTAAQRCASIAANTGFLRCALLDGGLEALGGGGASRAPRFNFISRCALQEVLHRKQGVCSDHACCARRHALALLLERGGGSGSLVPGEGGPLLLDVRRCDERTLYGAIPGSAHLPVEQLPRALAMGTEEWSRTFRFPKPHPGDALVLHSRGDGRARWAAQLASDAGLERCLVLREGCAGWRFDACVKLYAPYAEGEPPPPPQPVSPEVPDLDDAEEELYGLSLL